MKLGIPDIEPIANTAAYLATLPTKRLEPAAPEHRERLVLLGYKTIGEVAKAPRQLLTKQFADAGALIHLAATGRYADRVKPLYPSECVELAKRFEGGLDNALALEKAIARLAAKIAKELSRRDRLCSELRLFIEKVSGQVLEQKRRLSRPTSDSEVIQTHLMLMLGRLQLREPVVRARVLCLDLIAPATRQSTVCHRSTAHENRLHVEFALGKLHSAYGQESIRQAAQIRPSRRQEVLNAWKRAKGWH